MLLMFFFYFFSLLLTLLLLQIKYSVVSFLIIVEGLVVLYLSGESAAKTENSAQPQGFNIALRQIQCIPAIVLYLVLSLTAFAPTTGQTQANLSTGTMQ